jgi:drug/metabolite transporter (DMT)-like permease
VIYLTLVSLIWAFSFGLIKKYLTGLDPAVVAFARMALALPLFLPFLRTRGLHFRQIGHLMLIGAVQYGFMYATYLFAFRYLAGYQVALLAITTPLFVTFLNDCYSRRFHPLNLVWALLAIAGALVIVYHEKGLGGILTGILLMQVSNACFAWGQLAYKRLRPSLPDISDYRIYALLYLGALIVTAIASTMLGSWNSLLQANAQEWLVLIYLGVLASGLGFYWWNRGAVQTNPGTLAVFNNLKIPLTVAVSLLIFQEKADLLRLLIGSLLILVALFYSARRQSS